MGCTIFEECFSDFFDVLKIFDFFRVNMVIGQEHSVEHSADSDEIQKGFHLANCAIN